MKLQNDTATIEEVVRSGQCVGCGTCAAICPTLAIRMRVDEQRGLYIPELIEKDCNRCRTCLEACPGYSVDLAELNLDVFGKEPEDRLLGNYIGCYLAHATDSEIRYTSASGGLVTSLLIFALEQGLIDGALVTRMKRDCPLEPEPYIARTREDVLQAIGSKYCPVSVNTALGEILEQDGKYAVVGLPCHIYGVRKAEAANKILRERIDLHLGIFCAHTLSFRGTEFLLRKLGIRNEELVAISYRGGGWPGGLRIGLKNGGERFIPNQGSLWNTIFGGFFYTPSCCLSCSDVTNELADISFGDPWLREIMRTEREGRSEVISRSERGEALLHAAGHKGAIELEALDAKDVIKSQRVFLHFKKVNINPHTWSQGLRNREAGTPLGAGAGLSNRLFATLALANSRLASSRWSNFLLRNIPLSILRLYVRRFQVLQRKAITRDLDEFR